MAKKAYRVYDITCDSCQTTAQAQPTEFVARWYHGDVRVGNGRIQRWDACSRSCILPAINLTTGGCP